jgi:hypothetical protein
MNITARPAARWETLATDEVENLIVDLAVHDSPRHIVIIPRAVLTDVFGPTGTTLEIGRAHHTEIETAIGRAWHAERLQELVGVNHPGHIFQLWLDADDFA